MKTRSNPVTIHSITEMHRVHNLPEPEHPLISVVHFNDVLHSKSDFSGGCLMDFYTIAIKKDFQGKLRYGQSYYDFDEGVMSFIAPGQLCWEESNDRPCGGWMLLIHADFLRGHLLDKTIKNYEFFSYAVSEALYLSKKEEIVLDAILDNIEQEYRSNIDKFSQRVIISQLETLLNYADRFYHRQFITRSIPNNDLLAKLDTLLDAHFRNHPNTSLPTVKDVAEQLHVSPGYLGDMLRVHTGHNTQQHIHLKLIEKAKELLSSTQLTVAEIAYHLGFEHPQSFHKLFKRKTEISPLEFRQTFS